MNNFFTFPARQLLETLVSVLVVVAGLFIYVSFYG